MTDRYAVRQADYGYGVFDSALNGWAGPQNLDRADAAKRAGGLNQKLAERERAAMPDPTYREVDPPKGVIITSGGDQQRGVLTAWSRGGNQWWGWVLIGAHGGWYPATALRQADAGA